MTAACMIQVSQTAAAVQSAAEQDRQLMDQARSIQEQDGQQMDQAKSIPEQDGQQMDQARSIPEDEVHVHVSMTGTPVSLSLVACCCRGCLVRLLVGCSS